MRTSIFCVLIASAFASNAPIEEFIGGNKLFSADVYDNLQTDNYGNFVFSPYSAETLLAVIQSGAKDSTGDDIRSVLYFPSTQEETEDAMEYIIPAVYGDFGTVATLNTMAVDGSFTINEDFRQLVADVYQVQSFLEEQMVGSFANLTASNTVSFTNDLSMYGEWASKFAYSSTSRIPFYPNSQTPVNVNMMNQILETNYYESAELDAKILELPFKEDDVTLVIVLPNEIFGIDDLEKQIDKLFVTSPSTKEVVDIYLPRFAISSTIKFGGVLQDLGLKSVFDSSVADLSGIGGEKGELYISQIQQNVRIDVSESAVGGSAATNVDGFKMATHPRSASSTFLADHPFIFYVTIRDVIILAGRVIEPRV